MGTHPIFESDFDCLTENGKVGSNNRPISKRIRGSSSASVGE